MRVKFVALWHSHPSRRANSCVHLGAVRREAGVLRGVLGSALVVHARSGQTVMVIDNVLLHPLMILSCATVALGSMPGAVQTVRPLLSQTNLVALSRGSRFGHGRADLLTEAAVLARMAVVATMVIARTFCWEWGYTAPVRASAAQECVISCSIQVSLERSSRYPAGFPRL